MKKWNELEREKKSPCKLSRWEVAARIDSPLQTLFMHIFPFHFSSIIAHIYSQPYWPYFILTTPRNEYEKEGTKKNNSKVRKVVMKKKKVRNIKLISHFYCLLESQWLIHQNTKIYLRVNFSINNIYILIVWYVLYWLIWLMMTLMLSIWIVRGSCVCLCLPLF